MKNIIKTSLKQKVKGIITFVVVLTAAVLIIAMPEAARKGVSSGLNICGAILIPSLFPFMVLSSFMIESGITELIGRIFKLPAKYLFGLSPEGSSVVLMALVGGYPIGARMSGQLYKSGKISKNEAKNIILFALNSGPAFAIGAVGTAILGSRNAGIMIYASTSLSMLLMGIYMNYYQLAGRKGKKLVENNQRKVEKLDNKTTDSSSNSTAKQENFTSLTKAVVNASSGMLSICAWVIFFSAMTEVIKVLIKDTDALNLFTYIAEVTAGTNAASATGNAALIAFVVGFGGLCVHFQVLSEILSCGVKFSSFLISRLVHGTLAGIIAKVLFTLFPVTTAVAGASEYPDFRLYSSSIPASVALLFMCAILILDISMNGTRKKISFSCHRHNTMLKLNKPLIRN
jgi:sporulation integral membrane protein YlbJ